MLQLSEKQRKLLGLRAPPGAGKPPLPSPAKGASSATPDTGLRRRAPEPGGPSARASPGAAFLPLALGGLGGAATPPGAPPPSSFYGASPGGASIGFPSPGSSYGGLIETAEDLDEYFEFAERQRSDRSPISDAPLYLGLCSPYRPSPTPRAAAAPAAAAAAAGGGPEALLLELRVLHPAPRLELWMDRLREWISARVLQPLRHALDTSHLAVTAAIAAAPGMHPHVPSPLGAPPPPAGGGYGGGYGTGGYGTGGYGGGFAPPTPPSPLLAGLATPGASSPAAGAGAASPGAASDPLSEEAMLRGRLDELLAVTRATSRQAILVQPNAAERLPQYEALLAAQDALVRHLSLMALLRGASPAGLLAALPPGYVAARVRALAAGSCMQAFQWAGGGEWPPGRGWSAELPDDSALVLYLVTAFLLSPGWQFTVEALEGGAAFAPATGRGGPLYVAALPARPPERYSAVLVAPARPPEAHRDALALSAARAAPPHFHVFAGGRELAATGGHAGLLHALVLFLLHAEVRGGGALGPAALESPAVALASIFTEPGDRL